MELSIVREYFESENNKHLTKEEVIKSRNDFFLSIKDEFITTDDGSLSLKFQDTMHSYIGALKERLYAYTIPSKIEDKERLLDICSGFGYNALYALYHNPKLKIDMIEKHWEISAISLLIPLPENYYFLDTSFNKIKGAVEHRLSKMGYIKNLAYRNYPSIKLHIEEAEIVLSEMNDKFDVIFFDPYKSEVSPELFTIDFVKLMVDRLEEKGIFLTYLSNYAIRSALSCFLNIGKVELPLKKVEGTIASRALEEKSLDSYEERIISLTELGIPYRRADNPEEIILNRLKERLEMKNKYLLPSSKRNIVNFEDAFTGSDISLKNRLEEFGLTKELAEYIICPQNEKCSCGKCNKRYNSTSERILEMRKRIYEIKGFNHEACPYTH
ncbi:MAG: hypothetical protein APG12_00047 [Candidatus Methanofastidiosum methylothiophilum]|uniref:MnmC-like methyltransferase domain-containing protein n=1 Tax=Candidatus Methanofastidiosum methylothiophilum TaxID=1705564 RepID=A0A150J2Q7_9EURY|nr:MAG: hypothetical protein APG10_00984 [Candidatus Methanofastidiosum methylthiophilus]KYC48737.1 MAG: hypothetical protein APG11_00048 [Candidatus Methanofastidiosum methylthiophilus]KYC51385.1 MAG: hypothetical protein APG12_00047 [Candidatus Methanofastidiosum methylthiophilus]